ncbi:glycosyltransferase [Pseudoalteromonas piscicida]|uniref:glycosyltransferase n=1 Tax=Pseudoalteromonas piscicida TaxID=43662 RepID=UPI000E35FDAC|nr:glycosyltransferase [Pseudoalteromonas piscicida]AXQ99042.1 glycosyltransferase [Pseudoalteromonas piscicida]
MKKIYIVTSQVYSGGTATVTGNYYRMYKSRGYEVEVVSLDYYSSTHPKILNDDLHCFNLFTSKISGGGLLKKLTSLVCHFFKVCSYLNRKQGIFIYVHFDPIFFGLFNSLLNRNSKHIFTIHTNVYQYLKNISSIKKFIVKLMLRLISIQGEVVFLTEDVAKIYKEKYNKSRAINIPNFVNFDDVKSESNVVSNGILFCSRISYDKNIEFLVDIYENYRDLGGKYDLTIIGTGPEVELLKQQIFNSKYKKNIHFLGHQPNTSKFYKSAKIFLFTSKAEGFGLTIVEALGHGVPVVASNCPSGPASIMSPNVVIPYNTEKLTERGYLLPIVTTTNYFLYAEALLKIEENFTLSNQEVNSVREAFSEAVIFDKWERTIYGE